MQIACFVLPQLGIRVEQTRRRLSAHEPIVLFSEDQVAAVSDSAARFGIRPGHSLSGARACCPNLLAFPYDTAAYEEAAETIWDVLAVESSVVEPGSPEMAYVELIGRDAYERTQKLADSIAFNLDTKILVGLAKSKLVAHHAALQSRKGDVVAIPDYAAADSLSTVPITSLAQLDPKAQVRIEKLGIKTLGDVLTLPREELSRQLGPLAYLLRRLANGDDGDRVKSLWPRPSIESEFEFEDEIEDSGSLAYALQRCADSIAHALAVRREYGRALTLIVTFTDRSEETQREKLSSALADAKGLWNAAERLLGRMRIDRPVQHVRLKASDLGSAGGIQLALLDDNDYARGLPHERPLLVQKRLAEIRRRHGFSAVVSLGLVKEAQRISLWTYALTHRFDDAAEVELDEQDVPIRFSFPDRRGRIRDYVVVAVRNIWRETDFWETGHTPTLYRVETEDGGLYDLLQLGREWWLKAVSD